MIDAPAAGAASVATQLIAFYREPARWRPRYIRGEERFPEGHVVLKFALKRFAPGWHRDLSTYDHEQLVLAARAFVRQVCLWERATPYQLLCLRSDANPDAIKENYRLMMALMHPDRLESAHEWPPDAAQRMNEAHAVLADPARRREFDESLAIKAHSEQVHVAQASVRVARGRASTHQAGAGYLRRFAIVASMVAVIFVVQAWWMSGVPSHYGMLERAYPTRAANWMRDALPAGALPRFMEAKPTLDLEPLEPLVPTKMPQRLASIAVPTQVPTRNAAAVPEAGPAPASFIVKSPAVAMPPAAAAAAAAPRPEPHVLAQGSANAPIQIAQTSTAPGAPGPTVSSPATSTLEVEILVARLVSSYQDGDADALMALFDPDELGFWQGVRTRSAYADFFRASRLRRLRMDRLQWSVDAHTATARGSATVLADMADGSKLERTTEVSLELRLRGGQALITRLALYPDPR